MFSRYLKLSSFSLLSFFCSLSYANEGGIIFQCKNVSNVTQKLDEYLLKNDIQPTIYNKNILSGDKVQYILKDNDTSTVFLKDKYNLNLEKISLKFPKKIKTYDVISKKEIILSLMHDGKSNRYTDDFCNIDTFKDSVGVRQNTSAWGMDLDFTWFNGTVEEFNPKTKYWVKNDSGQILNPKKTAQAINNAFMYQQEYSIGCLTAARLLMTHGLLDYYNRVSPNKKILKSIISDLNHKQKYSLNEADPDGKTNKAKILTMEENISAKNILPGDWLYFKNTDEESSDRYGYEGSNAIYLGNNNFVDFFNSNNHHYSLKEKFFTVYQWRFGVFSETSDTDKIQPMSPELYKKLEETPKNGGLVQDYRLSYYLYAKKENGQIVKKAIFE